MFALGLASIRKINGSPPAVRIATAVALISSQSLRESPSTRTFSPGFTLSMSFAMVCAAVPISKSRWKEDIGSSRSSDSLKSFVNYDYIPSGIFTRQK